MEHGTKKCVANSNLIEEVRNRLSKANNINHVHVDTKRIYVHFRDHWNEVDDRLACDRFNIELIMDNKVEVVECEAVNTNPNKPRPS